MTVKTTRIPTRYTTRHLTRPLAGDPNVRAAGGALLIVAVLFAIVASGNIRAMREAEPTVQPQVIYQPIYIIATPTPPLPEPTAAPALVAAPPTLAPEPIVEPAPVYGVSNAPAAAPVVAEPVEEWHPPLVDPRDPCSAWHPPLAPPEGC